MSLKDYIGKNEKGVIYFITAILFCLFFCTFFYVNTLGVDSSYDQINISYREIGNNKILVTEKYDINLNSKQYYVLYKSFDERISYSNEFSDYSNLIINNVSCKSGLAYVSAETITILNDDKPSLSYYSSTIRSKILNNEVGCFKENQFNKNEKELLSVNYTVDKNHIQDNNNIHWLFSQSHFNIKELNVKSLNNDEIKTYYSLNSKNIKINVNTGDLKSGYSTFYIELLICLFLSFLPLCVWYMFGKEKLFTEPNYLHDIPNKQRTPWQASLFLNQTRLSKDGFTALFLSLKNKGVILDFKVEKLMLSKKLIISVKKNISDVKLDELEEFFIKQLYVFAKIKTPYNLAHKNKIEKFSTSFKERFIDKDDSIDFILNSNDTNLRVLEQIFSGNVISKFRKSILKSIGTNLIIVFFYFFISIILVYLSEGISKSIGFYAFPGFITVFILIIFLLMSPSSFFSSFKGDYYREYLQWRAFKNFLNDFALMKKYGLENKDLFMDWFNYAVALGSAKKVLQLMKELNILDDKAYNYYNNMYRNTAIFSTAISSSVNSANSRSSGGSAGGGGGFGGGGGGGR